MNKQTLRRVSRQLRQNRQRGFTLIELLVVVSILGILAAIVTMSLVGITKLAQQRSADSEQRTVQTAYDTMLADQQVPAGQECVGAPQSSNDATSDMKRFANLPAQSGVPQHLPVALSPTYLRQDQTQFHYWCSGNGTINRVEQP
jgi:prepilin-type N-terminal cleavage/methylation domain-containing protein